LSTSRCVVFIDDESVDDIDESSEDISGRDDFADKANEDDDVSEEEPSDELGELSLCDFKRTYVD
jgi:hypothetical protein